MVLHELGVLLVVSGVRRDLAQCSVGQRKGGKQAQGHLPGLEGKAGAFLASFAVEESSPPI